VRLAVTAPDGALLGVVYLLGIDWVHRSAELGLLVGEKSWWGRGVGTEATRRAIEHAFGDLNLHRVSLEVFEDNVPALRAYEHAGFVREGLKREAVYKDGRYRSVVVMGVLRGEERLGIPEEGAPDA
jgi:RimJ/RimL family protein N-acetyltransferase